MILTVTLNAAIDKRYVVEAFKEGEVNRIKECCYTPGGKGLNVARVAHIAGNDVIATGFIGGYSGEYIENSLKNYGVISDFYHVKGESRACINIWDETKKKQTEFLEPGLSVTYDEWREFIEKYKKLILKADVITISGSVPKGLNADSYKELIVLAKELGKVVILDTSGELLKEGIKACPTVIKPNIDEIRMLTGNSCDEISDIVKAAKEIHDNGVEIVAVSLGSKGALVVCSEGIYVAIVPKQKSVNSVGCGDSMIAGFAIGIEAGYNMEEILKKASAIAASSALQKETGIFAIDDMKKIYEEVTISKL